MFILEFFNTLILGLPSSLSLMDDHDPGPDLGGSVGPVFPVQHLSFVAFIILCITSLPQMLSWINAMARLLRSRRLAIVFIVTCLGLSYINPSPDNYSPVPHFVRPMVSTLWNSIIRIVAQLTVDMVIILSLIIVTASVLCHCIYRSAMHLYATFDVDPLSRCARELSEAVRVSINKSSQINIRHLISSYRTPYTDSRYFKAHVMLIKYLWPDYTRALQQKRKDVSQRAMEDQETLVQVPSRIAQLEELVRVERRKRWIQVSIVKAHRDQLKTLQDTLKFKQDNAREATLRQRVSDLEAQLDDSQEQTRIAREEAGRQLQLATTWKEANRALRRKSASARERMVKNCARAARTEELMLERDNLVASLTAVRKEAKTALDELRVVRDQVLGAKVIIDVLSDERDHAQNVKVAIEGSLERATKERDTARDELVDVNRELDELRKDNALIREHHQGIVAKVAILEKELAAARESVRSVTEERDYALASIDVLEACAAKVDQELGDARAELATVTALLEQMSLTPQELTLDIGTDSAVDQGGPVVADNTFTQAPGSTLQDIAVHADTQISNASSSDTMPSAAPIFPGSSTLATAAPSPDSLLPEIPQEFFDMIAACSGPGSVSDSLTGALDLDLPSHAVPSATELWNFTLIPDSTPGQSTPSADVQAASMAFLTNDEFGIYGDVEFTGVSYDFPLTPLVPMTMSPSTPPQPQSHTQLQSAPVSSPAVKEPVSPSPNPVRIPATPGASSPSTPGLVTYADSPSSTNSGSPPITPPRLDADSSSDSGAVVIKSASPSANDDDDDVPDFIERQQLDAFKQSSNANANVDVNAKQSEADGAVYEVVRIQRSLVRTRLRGHPNFVGLGQSQLRVNPLVWARSER